MVFVALIILALSAYNMQLAMRYDHQILDYEQRLARLNQMQMEKNKKDRAQLKKFKKEDIQSIRESVHFVNTLIIQDTFPWDQVLNTLEIHLPPGVILLNFELSEDRKKIKIEGKTHSMTEITRFMEGLGESSILEKNALLDLTIVSEDIIENDQRKTMDIKFQIESLLRVDELLKEQKTTS